MRAAESVLDHVAANLTPGGTFWSQWTAERGWTTGWHPDRTRLHARTLADATLFMLRAGGRWEAAARSNVDVALRTQREDGALPAAHTRRDGRRGRLGGHRRHVVDPGARRGGHLEEARRAGEYYAQFDIFHGAPEDVDLAPTSEDGYAAVMAFVALEDWETARRARRLDAHVPLHVRRRVLRADAARPLRLRTRGADQASPREPAPARVRPHLRAGDGAARARRPATPTTSSGRARTSTASASSSRARTATSTRTRAWRPSATTRPTASQAKGMLLTLSHAWSIGVLLYACEEALELGL